MPFHLVPARDRTLFRLVKKAAPVRLKRGARLYRPGTEAREVFLVREGVIRLVLPAMATNRSERTVAVALPWEVFGDEGLTSGRRRYGAVAARDSVVVPLPTAGVLRGLKTARSSLDAYLVGVERELHRLRHAQGGSRGPSAAQRLAEVLLDLADRCGEPAGRGIHLAERFTHQLLADLAGAHRATVTTMLNEWLYEGILGADRSGRLLVLKPTELWTLAGYHGSSRLDPTPGGVSGETAGNR